MKILCKQVAQKQESTILFIVTRKWHVKIAKIEN